MEDLKEASKTRYIALWILELALRDLAEEVLNPPAVL